MYAVILPIGLLWIFIASPAVAQRQCRNAPSVLRIEIEQKGTTDSHLGREKIDWDRAMNSVLRRRCDRCIWRGDPNSLNNARIDDEAVVMIVSPSQAAPPAELAVPRTTATIKLTVDHRTYDDALIEVFWERQADSLETWGRTHRPLKHSDIQGREDRLFSQLLDDLRAEDERIACLISSSRRTVSMVRFGLWTTELLDERDFGASEDLRIQTFVIGRWMDLELRPAIDVRLRGELGAGWLYLTESGKLFERNGGWSPVPVLSASVGSAAVVYPLPHRRSFSPYLIAGGDVVAYLGRDYTFDRTTWRPTVSFPSQFGWAVTAGIGLAKPYPVEVMGRWSEPTVRFIEESRTPTVFDLSIAMRIRPVRR